ncbi:ATP-binding cassette domain-containing protein [Geotalea uraniireducens]|uniref:ABC transporter related protein n=1 Tax=Geotalea uraniireducens (strain Rf4) TaxID=351605 RepID=A5G846_GEOUR|nr:ATP-binding cassette domain-containing protein [Geotalea uraniireducens]ABQ27964.1 ABC transporter related protein [Geotalea uraniireducens Rf4]
MSNDIAISVQNLTKIYKLYDTPLDRLKESVNPFGKKYHKDFYALNDVSFEIKKGETVGIIGKNGSGKSTLLKIITGVLTPTSGNVTVNGKISALLELGAGFNPELTGIENIYFNGTLMGYTREEMDARLDDILSFADIGTFVNQPVKSYSSGMFVRLAFSVATIVEPQILIVDEALSVGDVFFQQKCYRKLEDLRDKGVSILFVTHGMGDVVQFCQRALLLNDNRVEYFGKSPEAVKRYLLVQQHERLANYVDNVSQTFIHPDGEGDTNDVTFYWPHVSQFSDITKVDVVSNGIACCSGVALCNENGVATKLFYQGSTLSIFCEFMLNEAIEIPIGGFIIKNERNVVVHGKNLLHYDNLVLPEYVPQGEWVRIRFDVVLDIAPGEYTIDMGLSALSKKDYDDRLYSHPSNTQAKTLRLCHLSAVGGFTVVQKPLQDGHSASLHAGICNMPGNAGTTVHRKGNYVRLPEETRTQMPTILHVTHWKAGSQWIKKILKEAVPDLYVDSKLGIAHFLNEPIGEGMVYPTVYVTKEQFESVKLPVLWRRFVIIRDLRDTLISGYFSLKVSHGVLSSTIANYRDNLVSMSLEEGLIYLIDEWLYLSANIQKSWLDAGEDLIRYEDLLKDDVAILQKVLIEKCLLSVKPELLEQVIIKNRFEKLTGGRKIGVEDITAHERKGVAGDWQNYFTPKVKEYFKLKYGELLLETGYENKNDW